MKSIIKIIQYLFFLGIGVALLWLVFSGQDISKIWDDLLQVNGWWVLLSMLVGIISHWFRALRWNLLIEPLGYKTNTTDTFMAVMVGYLANLAVPRMGEITRCGVLSKRNKYAVDKIFGTVFIERAFDMLCLLFISFVVIVSQYSFLKDFLNSFLLQGLSHKINAMPIWAFSVLIAICIVLILVFLAIRKYFKEVVLYKKMKQLILGIVEGIKSLFKLKQYKLFLLYTFFIWLAYVFMIYICFLAMPALHHLTFMDAIIIMMLGSIGIVMPVPGGIGTYHYIISVSLMVLFFIDKDTSLVFAAVSHSSQMLLLIIGGSLALLYLMFKKKKNELS